MIHHFDDFVLRKPEPKDVEALYAQKNDPDVASLLGGFSSGYARADLAGWIDFHRERRDEVLWVIADAKTDACLGHVGLYQIDHRVRSAEFAIMLGDKGVWGRGIGSRATRAAIRYGFRWLNLNRIQLTVLETNPRAIAIYRKLGFAQEGVMRQAQWKDGRYLDVIMMSLLREEFHDDA